MIEEIQAQHWQKWLDQSVPRLGHLSPNEACKTARGRALIDDLLEYYDHIGGGSSGLNLNIPTKCAKWKLGYGPGSAEEFAAEEAIMNPSANSNSNSNIIGRPTERKERHTKRLETKKVAIFIPKRCEIAGCEKRGADVKACARCACAYYCAKDHQLEDWQRHKLECKALGKMRVELQSQPKPFESSKELEKYPLGGFPLSSSSSDKCFICHSKAKEVDMSHQVLQSPSL